MEEERRQFDESIDQAAGMEEGSDEGVRIPIQEESGESAGQAEGCPEGSCCDSAEDPDGEDREESLDDKAGEAEDDRPFGKKKDKKKKKKSAAALEIELKKAKDLEEEWKDKYQRLLAEFENARSRNAREQSRMYGAGAKDILSALLPVVDNFERGISGLSEEEKEDAFTQGILKIYQQLMTSLEEAGVSPMNPVGKEFDPNYHNAVMHEDNEEMGENLVAEEFQKGYMYKDEVLRHSMVKVVN